jgi:hypothetical protein
MGTAGVAPAATAAADQASAQPARKHARARKLMLQCHQQCQSCGRSGGGGGGGDSMWQGNGGSGDGRGGGGSSVAALAARRRACALASGQAAESSVAAATTAHKRVAAACRCSQRTHTPSSALHCSCTCASGGTQSFRGSDRRS